MFLVYIESILAKCAILLVMRIYQCVTGQPGCYSTCHALYDRGTLLYTSSDIQHMNKLITGTLFHSRHFPFLQIMFQVTSQYELPSVSPRELVGQLPIPRGANIA